MSPPKLLIVDASGLLYRAATRSISRPDKSFTQHANDLLEWVLGKVKPTHIVCVFDKGGSHYRETIFPQYKAQRARRNLKGKRAKVKEVARAESGAWKEKLTDLNIRWVEHEGIEADDVIAYYAQNFIGGQVVIATDDHDLMQLVCPRIRVFTIRNCSFITPHKVKTATGFHPWELRGLWALTGDKGDGIPGFMTIGGVTAETMYRRSGQNFKKVLQHLSEKGREKAKRNYDLVSLHPELVPDQGYTWDDFSLTLT